VITALPARLLSRSTVVLAGTLAAVVVGAALATLALVQRQAHLERTQEHTVLMARVFADQATRSIDAAALALATIAEPLARGLQPDDAELRAALAQTLVNLPFLRGIAIVDAQGQVLASGETADAGMVIDIARMGPMPAPGEKVLGPFVGVRRLADLRLGRADTARAGLGFLPLLSTVSLPGGRRVLVLAQINADALANFQQVTLDDERMASGLLAWNGTLLAATAGVDRLPGAPAAELPPFRQFLPAREHGSWVGAGLRQGEQIAAFRASRRWPVLVSVEFDAKAEQAQWWADNRGAIGLGLGVLVLIGVMTSLAALSVLARDQAQAAVAQREHEMAVTLQGLQELVFRCDRHGVMSFVNPAWARLTGQPAEAWQGRSLVDCLHPGSRDTARQLFEPGAEARPTVLMLKDSAGVERIFDCTVMPLADEHGGFVGSAVDVTERTAARRRLQSQLAFTEMLLESSPLPMSVMSRDRRYRIVNAAWEAFTGRRRDQAVGHAVGAHLPVAERRVHEAADERVYATGEPVRYDARVAHADGTLRDVVVEKRALPADATGLGHSGEPAGILAVVIDVTEFRAAERATREARDAAEEASRAKSEFVANISHELRTPLQSIIGFSELGQRRSGEQPRLAAMFDDIHGAGQRMLALVNDLLDVARIESSVGTIHLERADLRQPVREVLRELAPLAARRQILLDDTLPEQPMTARIDPLRFQQVVRNVVANAIRFSPDTGSVEIDASLTDAGEWCLRVADRGPGVPEAELERVFEAFVQSSRTKDGSGGTGLGLAICRTIMQAHGGRITARNRAGGGSVFEIVLPARGGGETLPASL
jgi:PAS domain S-box-containing protein